MQGSCTSRDEQARGGSIDYPDLYTSLRRMQKYQSENESVHIINERCHPLFRLSMYLLWSSESEEECRNLEGHVDERLLTALASACAPITRIIVVRFSFRTINLTVSHQTRVSTWKSET
jgi:hypothetical protein